jgi:arylsulfatase A-like enzyme
MPLLCRFFGSLLLCLTGMGAAASPDIILILADDLGYGDLGRHGNPVLKTPNLDAFHDQSVRFTDFCVSPSCSPTRASLLTGRDHLRVGVTHTVTPREHLSREAVLLPQVLKSAGYESCIIGKWHLGDGPGYNPQDRGFDLNITSQKGGTAHFNPVIGRNGVWEKQPRQGYREDIYFDEAMTFIRERRVDSAGARKPYFLYLATYSPHAPLAAPPEFIAPYKGRVDDKTAAFMGMAANLDWNVGRLISFLKQQSLDQDTLVIFMSDNGGTYGIDVHNAGMRGCKCTVWPGGTRAVSLWRWPARWQPQEVGALTAHLDVLPTLAELAEARVPDALKPKLEGRSLKGLLETGRDDWFAQRMVFQHVTRWPGGMAAAHREVLGAVRWQQYLLVRNRPCDDPDGMCRADKQNRCNSLRRVINGQNNDIYTRNALFHWGSTPGRGWALYDIRTDPGCHADLAEVRAPVVQKLLPAYLKWWDSAYPEMLSAGGDAALKPSMRPGVEAENR